MVKISSATTNTDSSAGITFALCLHTFDSENSGSRWRTELLVVYFEEQSMLTEWSSFYSAQALAEKPETSFSHYVGDTKYVNLHPPPTAFK